MSKKRAKSSKPTERVIDKRLPDLIGWFWLTWSGIELTTDYAIYKFLNVTPTQAHIILSGMMFGTKARLLADLIRHSSHPNKSEISSAFGRVRGNNLRDVLAHAYVRVSDDWVFFTERTRGGTYSGKEHPFTFDEFRDHVLRLARDANDFFGALSATRRQIEVFAKAALHRQTKSQTSPVKPTS